MTRVSPLGCVAILALTVLLFSSFAYSQAVTTTTTTTSNAAPAASGNAKVIFYYSRPPAIKHCLDQVGIMVDDKPVHQITQHHVWQTELPVGVHIISDDSRKEKGALTVTLTAGQTYYYEGMWHKGWGFPTCDNVSIRFSEVKPKDVAKVSALLGRSGIDETSQQAAAPALEMKPTTVKLSIASTPDAADIEVDGNFMGNTPSAIELAPGDHTVVVNKAGYKTWQRKIKLAAGDIRLNAQLEQESPKP